MKERDFNMPLGFYNNNSGPPLHITHVNAEHNHKLKVLKMAIELCGGNTAKKTWEILFK